MDPFFDAEFVEVVPFVGESEVPLEVAFNQGLDGRLYSDLAKLDVESHLVPTESFYIRTRTPDLLVPPDPWLIQVGGLVENTASISIADLVAEERSMGTHVLECSGNSRGASFGLMSSAEWHGVPLLDLLAELDVDRSTTRVLVSGFDEHSMPSTNMHSTPGASWVFSWGQLADTGAFLATRMNGEALPSDHGAPVRLLVPGWYGCTCIKWVDRIVIVADDEPATSQMTEFASRTHQPGSPVLARDFIAARLDWAAMPTRVERWERDGEVVFRVFGIAWGGDGSIPGFEVSFGDGPFHPVSMCALAPAGPWTFWEYPWTPGEPGEYAIVLRVTDPTVRTRRLDSGYYERVVRI